MRKLSQAMAVAFVFGVVACSEQTTEPQAMPGLSIQQSASQFTDNVKFPFSPLVNNTCSGELVQMEGELHFIFHETHDAAGGAHLNGSANFVGVSGTGLDTGKRYQLVGRSIVGFNGPLQETANGAFVGHFELTQLWITSGQKNNVHFKLQFHVTINANGDVAVERDPGTIFYCG
jgi:hypothetical protein